MSSRAYSVSMVSADGDGFADAIMEMAQETADEDERLLKKNVREAAKATRNELRNGALTPAMTGGYASGWSFQTEEGVGFIKVKIGNAKKPGLTHLLEHGHAKFIHGVPTGGRVRAYPHIEPAFVIGAEKLGGGL